LGSSPRTNLIIDLSGDCGGSVTVPYDLVSSIFRDRCR
jgi:hypothetical protein